jgi:hypothetical protein
VSAQLTHLPADPTQTGAETAAEVAAEMAAQVRA